MVFSVWRCSSLRKQETGGPSYKEEDEEEEHSGRCDGDTPGSQYSATCLTAPAAICMRQQLPDDLIQLRHSHCNSIASFIPPTPYRRTQ